MPSNLVDVDVFSDVSAPVGTDIRNAASVRAALQTLANRTRNLLNQIAAEVVARTNGDATLTTNLNTEISDRIAADAAAVVARDAAIAAAGVASVNDFRLTLRTATPITTNAQDQNGVSLLYLTPYLGTKIAIYTGTSWAIRSSAEISVSLSSILANTNYDVFVRWTGSALALQLVAWSGDLGRATSIVRQDGVWCRSGLLTDRYLGTIRGSGAGLCTDTEAKRFVWNVSNRVPRDLVRAVTGSWTYVNPSNVWRQANATAANSVEYVVGLEEALLSIHGQCVISNPTATPEVSMGVGIDQTTSNVASLAGSAVSGLGLLVCRYRDRQAPGYHKANWLETGVTTSGTLTFGSSQGSNGLEGTIEG